MGAYVEEIYKEALEHLDKWELDQAEASLRQVLELDGEHGEAWNKLGVVFARKSDLGQAEQCFDEAIRCDPHLASAYSNLGNIYAERGWTDRAQRAYEQALELDPGNPTATHNLGVLYRKAGQIGKGVELMKQASKAERNVMRRDIRSSPGGRRIVIIAWTIVLGLGALFLYLLNR